MFIEVVTDQFVLSAPCTFGDSILGQTLGGVSDNLVPRVRVTPGRLPFPSGTDKGIADSGSEIA